MFTSWWSIWKTKTIEEQGKKQIDAIRNQNKKLRLWSIKIIIKIIIKKILLKKIGKEKPSKIEELTSEIDHDNLIYYFENNTASKDCTNFENGVELYNKIKFGEMKLEDVKELQNILKSNLSKISKGRFKLEEQKRTLKNIKTLYK